MEDTDSQSPPVEHDTAHASRIRTIDPSEAVTGLPLSWASLAEQSASFPHWSWPMHPVSAPGSPTASLQRWRAALQGSSLAECLERFSR